MFTPYRLHKVAVKSEWKTVILAPDYLTDPTSVSLCIWTIIGLFNKLVKRERNYTKTISWHFLMDSKESRISQHPMWPCSTISVRPFCGSYVLSSTLGRHTAEVLSYEPPLIALREENSCTLAATENKKKWPFKKSTELIQIKLASLCTNQAKSMSSILSICLSG